MRRAAAVLVAAALSVAGCSGGGGGDGSGGSRRGEAPATTTTTLSLEGEVLAALDQFWKVLARAYYDLDPTGLDRVASGEPLKVVTDELAERKAKGWPMQLVEQHDYQFLELTANRAVLRDRIVNHSVRLDPVTREPTEPAPSDTRVDVLTFERREGRWILVDARSE